jgi:hypothetical protein
MFEVKSDFICIFKIGDNINYNLKVLKLLYSTEANSSNENKCFFCKPIIIIIASICEAILYDFHLRIRANTYEGILNLANTAIERIRSKKIDEFEKYIASARKNELFEPKNSSLYEKMDELRKLRNRIHIQNKKGHFEANEIDAFRIERKIMAEKILEQIIKQMNKKYYRPKTVTGYVNNFQLPWEEHFPNFI